MRLFNGELDAKATRAIDFAKDDTVYAAGAKQLVRAAADLDKSTTKGKWNAHKRWVLLVVAAYPLALPQVPMTGCQPVLGSLKGPHNCLP
jgi:hypothetical protein